MLKNIKKYIPKRKYRERSQLESRKKLGLLEKKLDYKIRAEDYHKKEKRFKKIKEDIRTKNPDEFYFKMANSKIIDGEHFNIRDEKDLEKRLGNHNKFINLVNYKKSVQEKEKEKLILNTMLLENKESSHKIFLDTEDDLINFKANEFFETDEKLLKNKSNRIRISQFDKMKLPYSENEIKQINAIKKQEMNKLKEKIRNVDNLTKISNSLSYQKNLIIPSRKKKLNEDGKPLYKFFNERKK